VQLNILDYIIQNKIQIFSDQSARLYLFPGFSNEKLASGKESRQTIPDDGLSVMSRLNE
jgi:hypothetical protein